MATLEHHSAPPRGSENILRDLLVTQAYAGQVKEAAEEFQEIPLRMIMAGLPMPSNVFLPSLNRRENRIIMVQVSLQGDAMRRRLLDRFAQAGLSSLYVHSSQMGVMLPYLNTVTLDLLDRPNLSLERKAEAIYDNAVQMVMHAIKASEESRNLRAVIEYVGNVEHFLSSNPECIRKIHGVLQHEHSVYTHSANVGLILMTFAAHLGLDPRLVIAVGLGGLFHDLGKSRIPREILYKAEELSDSEWELMRRHPTEGMQILRSAGYLPTETYQMVYQHHENLDGSGYPRGLRGSAISLPGQMIRIVDAYDALSSHRQYRESTPAGGAVAIINREMRGKINPELFASFTSFLGSVGKL